MGDSSTGTDIRWQVSEESQVNKQTNNIHSAEINKWIKGALCLRARMGRTSIWECMDVSGKQQSLLMVTRSTAIPSDYKYHHGHAQHTARPLTPSSPPSTTDPEHEVLHAVRPSSCIGDRSSPHPCFAEDTKISTPEFPCRPHRISAETHKTRAQFHGHLQVNLA